MRAELIERAEAMLKSRHIKSPFDVSHDELPSLLADFAADVLAEREAEIADELDKCCRQVPKGYRIAGKWLPPEPMPSPCDLLFSSVRNLINKLKGEQ